MNNFFSKYLNKIYSCIEYLFMSKNQTTENINQNIIIYKAKKK